MIQTITIPEVNYDGIVKLTTEPALAGNVFYGSFETVVKGKPLTVLVSNHIQDLNKEYKFRVAAKCKAGFIHVSDWETTPQDIITTWKKNTVANIQVEIEYENGHKVWANVLTIKSNKWYSIDMGFLKIITVGTIRECFPDMEDNKIWERMGAKTWADKAYVSNKLEMEMV